ncbi:hypothetical protein BGW38_010980 [Lunasporangiospora selenospora]|uniref:G-protein coupled receptors family 2 profile 2 domain-containing protein n=1 Tax=Lunasporangiospora selenospora TaxID=979761 RepID=A0A9P6KF56_9FUNG|nr:hypothetical protein BGW38_010980 [Lunasporangiospora selenospora]
MVEQGLNATGIEMVFQLPDPCKSTYLSYACSTAYPRPVTSGKVRTFNVLFGCKSTCEAVGLACKANVDYLQQRGILPPEPILPDCSAPIPNTELYPGGPFQYQPDTSCNDIPSTDIVKGVSAGLCLVLVISYLVLPGKLQHPSNLILFAAIATTIFLLAVVPSYGNPRRVQCDANGVTPASSFNNGLCAAQGAWLLFGAIAATAWLSTIIVNLHLHTVWNSDWLSRRSWLIHLFGWGVPAAFAAIAVATKSLGWNNSNMCMVTQAKSNALMFIPLGIIVVPASLVHITTFVHILRITLQSEISESVISRSTLSSGKAARISHRRHVLNAVRIQWRAAMLALVVLGSIMIYWAFYLVEGEKSHEMGWMSNWQLCIFTGGGDQESCGRQFAKGHVPDFVFMMIAETLVSSTGAWVFLLFFKKSTVVEWKELISRWTCCAGRRNRRRVEDQFYVI